jgi:hypothetical protein
MTDHVSLRAKRSNPESRINRQLSSVRLFHRLNDLLRFNGNAGDEGDQVDHRPSEMRPSVTEPENFFRRSISLR